MVVDSLNSVLQLHYNAALSTVPWLSCLPPSALAQASVELQWLEAWGVLVPGEWNVTASGVDWCGNRSEPKQCNALKNIQVHHGLYPFSRD